MTDFRTPRDLETWHWPDYAKEYYGGDVQAWKLRKTGSCAYEVWQRPHWGNPRVVARCAAPDAKAARRAFCDMAKADDKAHA